VSHRRLGLMVIAIAALMLFIALASGSVRAAQPPVAKIVSVDYPRHVLSGATFPVTIVADYSEKVGVDVGIWNVQSGLVVQSISIPLTETGRTSFTFKLTAPTTTVDWHLLAMTRIWWQDAWYQDPLQGLELFTVSVSGTLTVVLTSSGAASTITFDGSQYPLNNGGPLTVSVSPGIHHLEALPLIQGEVGEQFVFVGWSGGVNSNPRQIVISGDVNIAALYQTEYYLSVKSEYGRASGEGWYPQGSKASFAVVPTSSASSWFGLLTENCEFAGWSGDSNSSDILASVTMNGPRSVEAKWARSGTTVDPFIIANILLLASSILLVRGFCRYSKRRVLRAPVSVLRHWVKLIVVAMIMSIILVQVSSTYAQLPIQSGRSIVKIGHAAWYYWNNTASDTCLLWLGGGTTEERDIGYYSYKINPFQYESFGTIRFMQDLAKYYCVIALEKGSYEYFSPNSNRTIYQEPYQMDSRIIGDVHDWIRKQGYSHVFLVGYSTGAQVAAMEVVLRDPDEWASPDGLVLITPRLSDVVSQTAYRMRSSLLVLYGGSIETPAYISTGHEFYVNAPQDGWYGSYYFHQEFHVIERMGHEVWTAYETGAYDTQAVHILINFINDVESLQFTSKDLAVIANAANSSSIVEHSGLNLTSVEVPSQTLPAHAMRMKAEFTYAVQAATLVQLVAFNPERRQVESVAVLSVVGSGRHSVNLAVMSPSNSSEVSLVIVMLRKGEQGWLLAAGPLFTKTRVMQRVSVTVVSSVPISLLFDGAQFRSGETGILRLETKPGMHTLQIESVTYLNEQTRAVFVGWDDGSAEPVKQVVLDNDTLITAFYRTQYFVNATSPFGNVEGSGWYDANSTATVRVDLPFVRDSSVIFSHWEGDSNDDYPRICVTVNSPRTARVVWSIVPSEKAIEPTAVVWFALCAVLFAVTLVWNLKSIGQRNRLSRGKD